jgi:DNA-binding MarR family transcriptional regulator
MKKPRNTAVAPLVDPMSGRLGYLLRRVSVLMMADLGVRLEPTGLRPAEVTILLLIGANSGCQQGEVGEMLGIKRANMVPLISGLVEKGLVDRARADGRSHALSLTAKGRVSAAMINKLLDRHEAEFLPKLEKKELASLLAALGALRS